MNPELQIGLCPVAPNQLLYNGRMLYNGKKFFVCGSGKLQILPQLKLAVGSVKGKKRSERV